MLAQTLPRKTDNERLQLTHRELKACAKVRARSDKVPLLQSTRAQPQAKAIVHEHLQAIGAAVHKEVGVVRAGFTEHTHHTRKGRVDSSSHVQRLNGQPSRIDADHLMSSRSSSAHSPAADAGQCTLTVLAPRRTSIRIVASVALEESATGIKPPGFSAATLGAVDRVGTSKVPLSACNTQRRSRFAFSPRARATDASDTPGCRHAATASARKAAVWRRRRCRPILTAWWEVSTCPPRNKWTRMLLPPNLTRKVGSPAAYHQFANLREHCGSRGTRSAPRPPARRYGRRPAERRG